MEINIKYSSIEMEKDLILKMSKKVFVKYFDNKHLDNSFRGNKLLTERYEN